MEKEIHEMLYSLLKGNTRKITVGEIEAFLNNYARVVIKAAQQNAQSTLPNGEQMLRCCRHGSPLGQCYICK